MATYAIGFKPATRVFGMFDPSAVIFVDGEPVFGVEQERLTRLKHAPNQFPEQAIAACLDYCDIELSDVDELLVPYNPELLGELLSNNVDKLVSNPSFFGRMELQQRAVSGFSDAASVSGFLGTHAGAQSGSLVEIIKKRLEGRFGGPIAPIKTLDHHACHAASAAAPADFDDGLILTLDGKGEYDSTVVWRLEDGELSRERTYGDPNSLGFLYGVVTEFLGYRAFNGEGKVMGLAPYGEYNESIESTLTDVISGGVEYDVTDLISGIIDDDVERLEKLFGRTRHTRGESFTDWQKDLAYTVQRFLEMTVSDIVEHYCKVFETGNVGLAGGVALNCKMNKRLIELSAVDELFVQPLAHDGGLALGAGLLAYDTEPSHSTVYYGPEYTDEEIRAVLETNKIPYSKPPALESVVADRLADGDLVGWFQGRLEMGPRALGNRSILADPRTVDSRNRVNRYVKHREEWRPFAPSLLAEAADTYLVDCEHSPYMIKTFDVTQRAVEEIPAALHPADQTTRPHTVTREANPRYYDLISAFADQTGVPVVLNTSFNDSGEPIVTTPTEALKDFYGMGLDVLVIGEYVIEK